MRMTIEERERKFRATFESHNLDRFFAFAQDLMSDCSAADHAQTVWMDRKRELKQRIKELEAQRASVEQERDENEAARTCEKCGKTERGWKYNRCPDCGELAPDHAREGALRLECDSCGQDVTGEGYRPHRYVICHKPGCADKYTKNTLKLDKAISERRALADGKEGGE